MYAKRIKLPPLNALKAFRAVARQGSIQDAANELLVTPQAVSQQIKLLEETLEISLFEREGRTIKPTKAASVLSRFVNAGFGEFEEGVYRILNQKFNDRIMLNVSPYFATRFLLPQLQQFRESVLKSDLRLTANVETPDFARDNVDVAIQWGFDHWWSSLEVNLLLKDYKILCCTEEIASRIKKPQDILSETLLHPILTNTLWKDTLQFLDLPEPTDGQILQFHDNATLRQATLSGMGIGLISAKQGENDIRNGKLAAPLGTDIFYEIPDSKVPGFYLVLPKSHRRIPSIAMFCDWVTNINWSKST